MAKNPQHEACELSVRCTRCSRHSSETPPWFEQQARCHITAQTGMERVQCRRPTSSMATPSDMNFEIMSTASISVIEYKLSLSQKTLVKLPMDSKMDS